MDLYYDAKFGGVKTLRAARGEFDAFWSIVLLSNKVFEHNVAIKLFKLQNDFDIVIRWIRESLSLCTYIQLFLYAARWRHHWMMPLKIQ